MSHITKVRTRLRDGQVLRETLKGLGYEVFERGILSNGSSSGHGRRVNILAKKRGYKIGFMRPTEAHPFDVLADWEIQKRHREDILNEIFQAYSLKKIRKAARIRGYVIVKNRTNQKGQIEMTLRKVGNS